VKLRAGVVGSILLSLGSFGLVCACGSTLLFTSLTFAERDLSRFARGGASLGCRPRDSDVFPLFLICPGEHQSLGIAASQGKLSISCPELRPRLCRKLFERVRSASWKAVSGGKASKDVGGDPATRASDGGAGGER
jgi:hypothetical protein